MGDSVTTAKRALKIGRFQLQRLQLHDVTIPDELGSGAESRLDSAQASALMGLARFFLSNASPREPEILDLLAEIDEVDDAPSALQSGSTSQVSTSDVSGTGVLAGQRLRTGSSSYAPDVQACE